MTPRAQALSAVADETGARREDLVAVADPIVANVWAVRNMATGDEYLVHADGAVEEVEFRSWPPQARL